MFTRARAFTLVELLVVVTIIVVLLSLLAPALGKAVYQAQLAKCGAQMKVTVGGQQLYTLDNKRWYMYRFAAVPEATFSQLIKGAKVFAAVDADVDDRPVHKGYIDLDWLFDPLAEKVDPKKHEGEAEHPDETIYSNYSIQYGWGYARWQGKDVAGQNEYGEWPAMQKMGDRWEVWDAQRERVNRFQWLLSDNDINSRPGGVTAGHPDRDPNVLYNQFAQAGDWDYGAGDGANMALGAGLPVTYSFWRSEFRRGAMDLNFAADDGSVRRLTDVEPENDERIAHVPHQRNSGTSAIWLNIARQ